MTWIIVAISVCVIGFMVGICRACCGVCHKLCTPETEPTGSITVTLPALTTNGLGCGTCATFGDTYILDKLADPAVFGSTGCAPATFIDACYWGLDISPLVCDGVSIRETLLLSLAGNDGGIAGFEIRLDLCFYVGVAPEGITWIETYSDSLPFDCDDLDTRTLPYLSTGGFSLCTTADDASVTF